MINKKKKKKNETSIWYSYKQISIKWLFFRKRKNELNASNRIKKNSNKIMAINEDPKMKFTKDCCCFGQKVELYVKLGWY